MILSVRNILALGCNESFCDFLAWKIGVNVTFMSR